MKDDKHTLQQIEGGSYTCSRCCLTWKQAPGGACPGVKVYQYRAIPWDILATYTMLKRQKLKPADEEQPDGCYFRLRDKQYIYLYKIEEAQPRRTPTEAQRGAIVKMQVGLKRAYTCERCGQQGRYRGITIIKEGEPGQEQERRYCYECRDYVLWVYDRHVIEHNMCVWLESESAPPYLVIDTETTGLPQDRGFQVVEVAAVDKTGVVVFHSLVKPDIPMPAAATRIHGLTDVDLADAPSFAEIWPQLCAVLAGYDLWAYNADFDQAAILASTERFKLDIPKQLADRGHWHCLMLKFARYYGEYSATRNNRWKDLAFACDELEVQGNDYHRARGDALNALGVMRALAARGGEFPAPEERLMYSYYGGDY